MPDPFPSLILRRPSVGEVFLLLLCGAVVLLIALLAMAMFGLVGLGLGLGVMLLMVWHRGRRWALERWSALQNRASSLRRPARNAPPSAEV